MNPDVCLDARIVNNGSSCMSPGFHIKVPQYSDSINNNWNNWTAGTLNLFHLQYDWILTGQHDRQDKSLTSQIHNQSGHCPVAGRYFEPCIYLNKSELNYIIFTSNLKAAAF